MKEPLLLTTSSELQYADSAEEVLLLGEWCLPYHIQKEHQNSYRVLPHYGLKDDVDQRDFDLAQNYYNKILPRLAKLLNTTHEINKSDRYWEIIIGHWLWRFIKVCVNRFNTVDNLFVSVKTVSLIDYEGGDYKFCTKDGLSSVLSFRDDRWNYEFYRVIIKRFYANRVTLIKKKRGDDPLKNVESPIYRDQKRGFLHSFFIWINHLSSLLSSRDQYFIISTYLPKFQELFLHITLRQFPRIHLSKDIGESGAINEGLRNSLKSDLCTSETHDDFELLQFIDSAIFDSIPISYLEDFKRVRACVDAMPWPKKPKVIFTANNFDFDEVFKIYVAENCEKGATYLVGQHGGVYGSYRYVNNPSIEEKTSDYFLTWGHKWNSKHVPSCMMNAKSTSRIRRKKKGYITLIEAVERERVETHDTCYEYHQYFQSQTRFVNSLSPMIIDRLLIRLGPNFKSRTQFEDLRWSDYNKKISLDLGCTPVLDIYKNSSLIVHTYDSTGLLETLAMNIPTIGFWETGYSHLRDESREHYKLLVESGILFLSAESAAQAINKANGEFDLWWHSSKIQDARLKFTEVYCNCTDKRWSKLKSNLMAAKS